MSYKTLNKFTTLIYFSGETLQIADVNGKDCVLSKMYARNIYHYCIPDDTTYGDNEYAHHPWCYHKTGIWATYGSCDSKLLLSNWDAC